MGQLASNFRRIGLLWVSSVAVSLICGPLTAQANAATFAQVGTFGGILAAPAEPEKFPEEAQLGGTSGIAVNVDGAGGVPAGTLYAASFVKGELWVARYNPDGSFSEAWQVRSVEGEYKRCGPDGKPEEPHCAARADAPVKGVDVDIDQTTGNVYVLNGEIFTAGDLLVSVYTPDGSELITRFGEQAAGGETIAASPGKIHNSPFPGGLAVGNGGKVYVFDVNLPVSVSHRLMVFEPESPGDYEHYVYAGQGKDLAAGLAGNFPTGPVADAAGNLYVAGETYIEKYIPSQPGAPVCTFSPTGGGIKAMTVDRESGEVFYYTSVGKQVHQLSPCEAGKFTPTGTPVAVAPERDNLFALAFDPVRQFSPGHEAGVLYGVAPSAVPSTSGKGQPGRGGLGYVFAPVEENPPLVLEESVSDVGAGSAEAHAQINPRGPLTRYAFQYLSAAAYEEGGESFIDAAEAPAGGGVLGSGQAPLAAAEVLGGLAPDTEYRYRVVATSNCSASEPSKVCEAIGPTRGFHTFPAQAPGLPDGRAYELVSPPRKYGGQVLPADPGISSCGLLECKPGVAFSHFPMQSSPDGEAIVYEGTPFTPGEGAAMENEYRAQRTVGGWITTNLSPALMQSKSGVGGYRAFNPELSQGLVAQFQPALTADAPVGYVNLYSQPAANPLALDPLLTEANAAFHRPPGSDFLRVTYAGASKDLSRVFFEANDALIPEAVDGGAGKNNLYEWSAGELRLVNFAPGDAEPVLGAFFGSGTLLKSGGSNKPTAVFTHAISEDGSRAFWSSEAGQAYVRIDGAETRKIESPGKFLTASASGSKALLDDGCLYDVEEGVCEDLTADEGGTHRGGFLGLLGQSEDLSHVYFADTAVLTGAEENEQGAVAEEGKPNLYAFVEGTTSFVATLLTADNGGEKGIATADWQASASLRTAEASPAGRYLAFLSRAPLTGFDNTGPCDLIGPGEAPCPEAFLYDSVADELTCASCGKSGARPLGQSVLRLIRGAAGSIPQPRYLTDSGRLYFDSRDSLVPGDTNAGVEDVYQYEPEGVGDCEREGGCVALISAGREGADSNLVTIDESGENVFFTTRDRLVAADHDDLIDLYDARVGGGFPAESQAPAGQCEGEACQGSPPAGVPPPPASSTYAAPRSRCKQGQVRRRGRCVKKRKAKKQKQKEKQMQKHGGRGR